jgi:hypothetical protein
VTQLLALAVPLTAFIFAALGAVRSQRPLPWIVVALVAGLTVEQGFWFAVTVCDERYPCEPLDEAPTGLIVGWSLCAALLAGRAIALAVESVRGKS